MASTSVPATAGSYTNLGAGPLSAGINESLPGWGGAFQVLVYVGASSPADDSASRRTTADKDIQYGGTDNVYVKPVQQDLTYIVVR